MGYVDKTVAPGEQILAKAQFHWVYGAVSLFWLLLLGWLVIGIFVFLFRTIAQYTTEIVVTNRRFVYKRGWLARETNEFSTQKIEGVNLSQGLIGRILGFGRLTIRGSGIGEVHMPAIKDPLGFRRALIQATDLEPSPPPSHIGRRAHEGLEAA